MILIKPFADASAEGDESVTLTLVPESNYMISATGSATVTIHDSVENITPEISAIDDLIIDEDTSSPLISFTIGPPAIPADRLSLMARSSNPALIPDSNILLAGNGPDHRLTIRSLPNQSGTATITLAARDGNESVYESFQITVRPVNDPPSAADETASTEESITLTLFPELLLANDSDPGDSLTLRGVDATSAEGGSVTWKGSIISYNPPPGFHGFDTLATQ